MNSYFVLISWLCFLVSIGSSLIVQKTPRLVDPASYSSVKNSFYLHTSQKDESSSEYNQAGIKYSTDYYDKMPVDHFVADSTNTFSLKYLYNMDSYKPGGPLFFYTGNEGAIELFAEVTGIMFDLAPVFNAAIVFGEHRYYGRRSSMPMGEGSLKDVAGLRYLNTQQALADYATLIPYVKTKFNISSDTPVIAFGGSYGGMLAAWFRMKYPNIVTGAWASSAPMIQFRHGGVPFDAASALIQKTFADSGCKIEAILKGYAALTNLSKTNINKLNEIFNIEAKSVLQDASDVDYLLDYIQEAFFYLAMTDYPYPTNFLMPLPAWPVEETCMFLAEVPDTDEGLVTQLQKAVNVFYNSTSACVKPVCGDASTAALGVEVPWNFQYCTEIVISMCSSGPPNDFFKPDCNATTFEKFTTDTCLAHNTSGFTSDMIRFDAIENNYGLSFESTSNIIFTNGALDPWSTGGVTEKTKGMTNNLKRGLYVYSVGGSGHHLDLRQPNLCDPVSVKAVRYQIVSILKCWTGLSPTKSCSDGAALQQPLPAFTKVNSQFSNCNSTFKGYPWGFGHSNTPENSANSGKYSSVLLGLCCLQAMFAAVLCLQSYF